MRRFLSVIGLLAFAVCQAQNENPNREAFVLKVQRNSKQSFIQQIQSTPYFIEQGALQLYPNEKVYVELDVRDGVIVSMQTVAQNLNPDQTIEIEFCQFIEHDAAKPTLLYIKNPFDKKLKYDAIAYQIEESQWVTEAQSADKKYTSVQKWPMVISSLVFKNWAFEKVTNKN